MHLVFVFPWNDPRFESPAGLVLTALVFLEYKVALLLEEYVLCSFAPSQCHFVGANPSRIVPRPFTAAIYEARERARALSAGKGKGKTTAIENGSAKKRIVNGEL